MTTTRCIGQAMKAASRDPSRMTEIVNAQPETCPHGDCTASSCKQAVSDSLRPMYRAWRERTRANGQGELL